MPTLLMENISKQFGGLLALRDARLEVVAGEVHGLLGANGSGKSTLIKILAGFHAPEAGAHVAVAGQQLAFPVPETDLRRLGVAFVHQDLALFTRMSVLDNLRVTDLTLRRRGYISWRTERRAAKEILDEYGLSDIDPRAEVSDLSRTDRARLAIARAFATVSRAGAGTTSRGLVVLDEPTAFLPSAGVIELFRLTRAFAADGGAVIFVSHNLEEVCEITDRVTVLRDGAVAGVRDTPSASADELVDLIVGRNRVTRPPRQPAEPARRPSSTAPGTAAGEAVTVSGLRAARVHDVSFEVGRGEILGVAGLVGSGCDDLPYLLFGAQPVAAGGIRIGSRLHDLSQMSPPRAVTLGMALVPAERPTLGIFGDLTLDDNLSPTVLHSYTVTRHLRRGPMRKDAARLLRDNDVRPPNAAATMSTLSGGNQQKVIIAKWLRRSPDLLILHEPTQGVDVGARHEIYQRLLSSRAGRCTICVSNDHDELATLCDRVLVFHRGNIVATLTGSEVEKSRISEACMRGRIDGHTDQNGASR